MYSLSMNGHKCIRMLSMGMGKSKYVVWEGRGCSRGVGRCWWPEVEGVGDSECDLCLCVLRWRGKQSSS